MKKIIGIVLVALCLLFMPVFPAAALTNGTFTANLSIMSKDKIGDTQLNIKCQVTSKLKNKVTAKYVVLKDTKVLKEYSITNFKKKGVYTYLTKDKFVPGNYRVELHIKVNNSWQLVDYSNITIKAAESVPVVTNIHYNVDFDSQKILWTNPKDMSKIEGFKIYTKKEGETQWDFNTYVLANQNSIDLSYLSVFGNSPSVYEVKVISKAKSGFKDSETICEKRLTYIYDTACKTLSPNKATMYNNKITVSYIYINAGQQYLIITSDATDSSIVNRRLITASKDYELTYNVDTSAESLDKIGNHIFLQKFYGCMSGDGSAQIWASLMQVKGTIITKEQLVNLNEVGTYDIVPDLQTSINQCTLPEATPQHLPYWTGFNFCNKMQYNAPSLFNESDIKLVHDMGFNFLRVAIHYKTLLSEDGTKIKMSEIENIDQLIEWGIKYNVHINLDLHYLPGHGPDDQGILKQDLLTNEENQRLSCEYWTMFAKRYAGIPNRILSFNLLNEPHPGTSDQDYTALMSRFASAVRTQDANRLMIIDALPGGVPSEASNIIDVAQSMHFYEPANFTTANFNYTGEITSAIPQGWPMEYVYGTLTVANPWETVSKPSTITINGTFSQGTKIKVNVDSGWSGDTVDLVMKADGVEIRRQAILSSNRGILVETNKLQSEAKTIELSIQGSPGSFFNVNWISVIQNSKQVDITTTNYNYNSSNDVKASILTIDNNGKYKNTNPAADNNALKDINWMRATVKAWKDFAVSNNVGIMCGEFGVAYSVPHQMALDYLKDWLTVLQENKIGWSFYEFTGWFGLFNNPRKDIVNEPYGDLLVDYEMMKLLQQFQ